MRQRILHNHRIILRAPEPEDLEIMYKMENLPEMWAVSNVTVPYSRYTLKRYIENCRNDIYNDGELRLMIQLTENQKTVGTVDLIDFTPLHERAEVGIAILEDYRKQGIAREALVLLRDYAFKQLHIHLLYAYIAADNSASLHLFKTCGFTESSVLKDWLRSENGYKDVYLLQNIATSSF